MSSSDALDIYANYLRDLGLLLKEYAFEAKSQAAREANDFALGHMAGFHRVISLMQQQAESFGLTALDVGLGGIDPDEDLVDPTQGRNASG